MKSALTVLAGGNSDDLEAFASGRFALVQQPTRPGLAYEPVTLVLDAETAQAAGAQAAVEGLPVEPWAALVIESERALRAVAGRSPDMLAEVLDRVAREPVLPAVSFRRTRLASYAAALDTAGSAVSPATPRSLVLPVPYHSRTAWELAAVAAGLPVAVWATGLLQLRPHGRTRWEVAAAKRGQTLGEWVAAQAARASN